jgi:hypothetical protein
MSINIFNTNNLDNSNFFHTFAKLLKNTMINMTTNNPTFVMKMLDAMSVEELKNRLAD